MAKDWNLRIDKLEVKESNLTRTDDDLNKTYPFYFSVIAHVSPDPKFWGLNEMD
ncbi:hypothetical protein [Endozoicomonas sp. YOMI1]|uniref:hypothetical protein n=1 Tax=Endozoicomonas sp. YOMI1 TaxID=2828739 RepID=UPI00214733AA|nr:hypothetical protein [Endozoicomonas sp. YOMI1]